jgi:FlaA1/EpsC-like NDP-sugar epimerase
LILAASEISENAAVFVPELGEPVRIVDLAKRLVEESGRPADEVAIVFTGLRPGDKLAEELVSSNESLGPTSDPRLRKISAPGPSSKELDLAIRAISEGLRERNLPALLDTLCNLVPEYQPSDALLALATRNAEAMRAL